MKLIDYLRDNVEEMPEWLSTFKVGDPLNLRNLLSSRLIYYPGAGFDGQPISSFNQGNFAHVYIYVDYGIEEKYLKREFLSNGFRGYQCIDIKDINQKDFVNEKTVPTLTLTSKQLMKMKENSISKEFGFVGIFERMKQLDDSHGVKRFVLIYLGADGIATYNALFASKSHASPTVLILQDHGYGGNYDQFGKDGLMHQIALKSKTFPEYILCAENTSLWDGYELIPNVDFVQGGMHHSIRWLYKKIK